jgi:hemerythrin-like domain-containing protein
MPRLPDFEVLDQAHRDVMAALADMQRLLEHVGDKGPDAEARASAQRIIAFFNGPAREHHAHEERHVFPALLASGNAELVQNVQRLRQDHGWLEEDWIELSLQMQAIAEGYNWYDIEMLRRALPIFAALYQDHIALEDGLVYPAARAHAQALRAGVHERESSASGEAPAGPAP